MASPKEIGILPSNRKNKHGFTLMETVIAVMIFIIVSVGVYSVFTRLVRLSIISKQKIGTIITSETTKETQLHFEIWKGKETQNPVKWLYKAN